MASDIGTDWMTVIAAISACPTALWFHFRRSLQQRDLDLTAALGALAAGLALLVIAVLFAVLAGPTLVGSWDPDGTPNPGLIGLNVAAIVLAFFVLAVVAGANDMCRYILDCFHRDDLPVVLRRLRDHWDGQR